MKVLLIILFISSSVFTFAQSKPSRYFQATYITTDTVTNGVAWGTYFFETNNGAFVDRIYLIKRIVKDYKIRCRTSNFVVSVTEFRNKKEWLMFNKK